ncbi:hypothetical protein KUCAC02_019017 [Chaenocephalus aceratus]|uniref:Uncharacterized protein n=1 Tax=Chaenocephalus aceratus TaxID=36190 RepID=A0ACB9WC07_CHAAC|nr:hypothetical protein KUCAC02_019017 [Chaenocephalus aceratus]
MKVRNPLSQQRAPQSRQRGAGEDWEEREMEERKEDQERAVEEGEQAGKEGEKENKGRRFFQSPQPMGAQCESVAELPLDSVAIIRDLVTEITEVEAVISPVPTAAIQPDTVTMTTDCVGAPL